MPKLTRRIAIHACALQLLACSSWKPVPAPLPEHLAAQTEQTIRLTLVDGRRLELDSPRVTQDSLVGFAPGALRTRIAVPLDQLSMVEYSRTDYGKTALAVLGGVGVVAAVVTAVGVAEYCEDWC